MYPIVHKIKNKDKETGKLKKKMKKKIYLHATVLEPTSFECKNTRLSNRLSGNMNNFIQISNNTTVSSALFTKIHED